MGRPSNLSRMIERVLRAAAEAEVTRHENLTKPDIASFLVQFFCETDARAAGHSLMSSALL